MSIPFSAVNVAFGAFLSPMKGDFGLFCLLSPKEVSNLID